MPDPTAPRRAYDSDGTGVFTVDGGVGTPVSDPDKTELNNSSATGGVAIGTNDWLAFVFPNVISIESLFIAEDMTDDDITVQVETSLNSTDGGDGTWSFLGNFTSWRDDQVVSNATWRTGIDTGITDAEAKAIRIGTSTTTTWRAVHIYGGGEGEDSEGLEFRDAGSLAFPFHDWEVTPQASSDDTVVIVANTSTRTARQVNVTVEAAEDSDAFALQHYLSLDGRNFTGTLSIGDIGARSQSQNITIRRVTPAAAATGTRAARLVATATLWE